MKRAKCLVRFARKQVGPMIATQVMRHFMRHDASQLLIAELIHQLARQHNQWPAAAYPQQRA
jgi:hypothetical protein